MTDEEWHYASDSQSYEVELKGLYLGWIECSNYKLLPKLPEIDIYREDGTRLHRPNCFFRMKGENSWQKVNKYTILPFGLIELKIEPDATSAPWINTFFAVPGLEYNASNATESSAVQNWTCGSGEIRPVLEEDLEFTKLGNNSWRVIVCGNSTRLPSVCRYVIYSGQAVAKPLEIGVACPFVGVSLLDSQDQKVKNHNIISVSELHGYKILCNGINNAKLQFSYESSNLDTKLEVIKVSLPLKKGITSLTTYEDIIDRIFNLYGYNDRSSAVTMLLGNSSYAFRKFSLDSVKTSENEIKVFLNNVKEEAPVHYDGKLFAYELINDTTAVSEPIELAQINDNTFVLPQSEEDRSYVVFSDAYDMKRIIPKRYFIKGTSMQCHSVERTNITNDCKNKLENDPPLWGSYWPNVLDAFKISSQYRLPLNTLVQVSVAMSTPKLFARFLVAIYFEEKKDLVLSEIQRLEQEFAIAVHWLKYEDMKHVFDYICGTIQLPDVALMKLLEKFVGFVRDLQMQTIDDTLADIFKKHLVSSPFTTPTDVKTMHVADLNEYFSRAHGYDKYGRDMPSYPMTTQKMYYDPEVGRRLYHHTMINAPLVVYEHLVGLSDSLWENPDLTLRRTINFYRKYYMRTYCEIMRKIL